MIGDKLVITDYHRELGRRVAEAARDQVESAGRTFTITVAGESGSGKSETAATTGEQLEKAGYKVAILGQDDYFKLPPKSNAARRLEGIEWVGPAEVHLDLMDQHLKAGKDGVDTITKPLVHFEDDRIGSEQMSLVGIDVIIAEGTYTTLLDEADFHAFIDRTYHDTLEHRRERARDEVEGDFIERVLEIEHRIIREHKARANLVLPPTV